MDENRKWILRALAAVALIVGALAVGGTAEALPVSGQLVMEETDDPDSGDEDSDESSDEDSEDSGDSDSDDSDNNDDSDSDDESDEPTDEPTDTYTDPNSDGSVEMPTTGSTDDTAATEDEPASSQTLGWALAGGGLLAAVGAFFLYRRSR